MELVMVQRKAFREGLKTDFYRNAAFDIENSELFKQAVYSGYGDAKRTFKGIGKFWKDKNAEKEAFFATVAESIQAVFTDEVSDNWHEQLCEGFCSGLTQLGYENVTYGQAQKVINMAFKYLYCIAGAEDCSFFARCHMPLDSYTLSWYHKFARGNAVIHTNVAWSTLKKDDYIRIQQAIRSELENCTICIDNQQIRLPKEPLLAECIVWPEEILLAAGNGFMKAISEDYKKVESDSMTLFKKILCDHLPRYCNLDISISTKK